MTHAHMTAWFLALVLFLVAFFLQKGGKAKGAKIVSMVLRVVYLLILATGIMLLFSPGGIGSDLTLQYIFKAVVGVWVIGSFEMILAKHAKKQRTTMFWISFVIAFALALYLGFSLPMGS
jgi:uncharacterized membrane protein SirB2